MCGFPTRLDQLLAGHPATGCLCTTKDRMRTVWCSLLTEGFIRDVEIERKIQAHQGKAPGISASSDPIWPNRRLWSAPGGPLNLGSCSKGCLAGEAHSLVKAQRATRVYARVSCWT